MGDCNSCKSENKTHETVPYIVHESSMARMERTAKRLWITILTLILLLVGTNGAWLLYNSQFETAETVMVEYQSDAIDK